MLFTKADHWQRASSYTPDKVDAMLESTGRNAFPEGSLLIRELSHRIKNEFTSAINAISLAAARSHSGEVKAALNEVGELLHRYADVHRTLQIPADHTYVDAASYLRKLCLSISRSKLELNNIQLVLAAHPLSMSSDRCWWLGLIVHELIANAACHAFNGAGGEIRLELSPAGAAVECRVSDNGAASRKVRPGHGSCIVQELVMRLDGRLEQSFGPRGSTSILLFPV